MASRLQPALLFVMLGTSKGLESAIDRIDAHAINIGEGTEARTQNDDLARAAGLPVLKDGDEETVRFWVQWPTSDTHATQFAVEGWALTASGGDIVPDFRPV